MIKTTIGFLAVTFFFFSCSKLEDPDNVKASDKISIIFSMDSVTAFVDTITVYAKVPNEAIGVDISFTATAGNFLAAAGKTIKQIADSVGNDGRYAAVRYVPDSSMTAVYFTAEATNARSRKILTINK